MRKWLILFICLFFICTANAGQVRVLSPFIDGGVTACAKDTGTLVMDVTTATSATSLTTDAAQQTIAYASNWQLFSIKMAFANSNATANVTVRIGTSSNLSTYMEQWTTALVEGTAVHEFISVDQDTFTASTTYYIGVIENDGYTQLSFEDADNYPGGDLFALDSTGWTVPGTINGDRDWTIQVFKTTVTPCE